MNTREMQKFRRSRQNFCRSSFFRKFLLSGRVADLLTRLLVDLPRAIYPFGS